MPILMITLFALAVFGLIGILLAAALMLETKKANASGSSARSGGSVSKPAA